MVRPERQVTHTLKAAGGLAIATLALALLMSCASRPLATPTAPMVVPTPTPLPAPSSPNRLDAAYRRERDEPGSLSRGHSPAFAVSVASWAMAMARTMDSRPVVVGDAGAVELAASLTLLQHAAGWGLRDPGTAWVPSKRGLAWCAQNGK